jgi:alginate O-acetyltransferase complex protein AlgI
MLFNSYAFLFVFLPITVCGYFLVGRRHQLAAAAFLVLASLFFYGWWNPKYVALLLISVAVNYIAGTATARAVSRGSMRAAKWTTVAGITFDLVLLGYYKYANFFVDNLSALAGVQGILGNIVLPLGISFFTFTQIAFLADTYKGLARECNFAHYALFVTYFPHLIAGPILHHKEMMPQFAHARTYRFNYENMAVGATIFFIGLFKKVVLADSMATYVAPVFDAPKMEITLSFIEAWCGAICYGLQLYFDFSGYSDMAIGLSRLFGVTLPLNFHSPYKSVNIVEFWRRWHMTLSRFLRHYLYIPLGGNRHGIARRYANLFVTMVLGGLWHGAGWTFVIWGALHGLYLIVNHGWHALRRVCGQDPRLPLSKAMHAVAVFITFLAVTVGWVFFRADNFGTGVRIAGAMFGLNGLGLLPDFMVPDVGKLGRWLVAHGLLIANTSGLISPKQILFMLSLLLVVWFAPNTQQILRHFDPALDYAKTNAEFPVSGRIVWRPNIGWVVIISAMAVMSLFLILTSTADSPFLYYQF